MYSYFLASAPPTSGMKAVPWVSKAIYAVVTDLGEERAWRRDDDTDNGATI